MNGMMYKLAGIGALIWLVGIIIGATGLLSLQHFVTLSGIGVIIAGIGIILVALGFFGVWKVSATLVSMLAMLFGFIAGVLALIEGILLFAAPGAVVYVGVILAFMIAAFFILAGMVFYSLEKTAPKPFLHEAGTLSLVSAVASLSLITGLSAVMGMISTANLGLLPAIVIYIFVFFKM